MFSDPDEIPDPKLLKNIELKDMGYFFRKCTVINLTFIMNMKAHGKEQNL